MENQDNVNDWMSGIKASLPLPDGKGKITAINEPREVETKFGKRKVMQIVIEGADGSIINTQLFLPSQFPIVHLKSNLAKIMRQYGCNELKELLGKEVEVVEVGDMMWKIKAE